MESSTFEMVSAGDLPSHGGRKPTKNPRREGEQRVEGGGVAIDTSNQHTAHEISDAVIVGPP